MARKLHFTIKINEEERAMIDYLAAHLQRSRGDAIRLVVRKAVKNLKEDEDYQLELHYENDHP